MGKGPSSRGLPQQITAGLKTGEPFNVAGISTRPVKNVTLATLSVESELLVAFVAAVATTMPSVVGVPLTEQVTV
jgi:hypothetical protein